MDESEAREHLESKFLLVSLVYSCLLLDNMLLTVIGKKYVLDRLYIYYQCNKITINQLLHVKSRLQLKCSFFPVPILPDFLSTKIQKINMINNEVLGANSTESFRLLQVNYSRCVYKYLNVVILFRLQLDNLRLENGSVGLLLSVKAIVQLLCNPLVGILTKKIGYRLPIFLGMLQLWLSSFSKCYTQYF